MLTMSQKSTLPQAAKSVSQALMSDSFHITGATELIISNEISDCQGSECLEQDWRQQGVEQRRADQAGE